MIGRVPLEQHLSAVDINLLEGAVKVVGILCFVEGNIALLCLVDGEDRSSLVCDPEPMKIGSQVVLRFDLVGERVCFIQLYIRISDWVCCRFQKGVCVGRLMIRTI